MHVNVHMWYIIYIYSIYLYVYIYIYIHVSCICSFRIFTSSTNLSSSHAQHWHLPHHWGVSKGSKPKIRSAGWRVWDAFGSGPHDFCPFFRGCSKHSKPKCSHVWYMFPLEISHSYGKISMFIGTIHYTWPCSIAHWSPWKWNINEYQWIHHLMFLRLAMKKGEESVGFLFLYWQSLA